MLSNICALNSYTDSGLVSLDTATPELQLLSPNGETLAHQYMKKAAEKGLPAAQYQQCAYIYPNELEVIYSKIHGNVEMYIVEFDLGDKKMP